MKKKERKNNKTNKKQISRLTTFSLLEAVVSTRMLDSNKIIYFDKKYNFGSVKIRSTDIVEIIVYSKVILISPESSEVTPHKSGENKVYRIPLNDFMKTIAMYKAGCTPKDAVYAFKNPETGSLTWPWKVITHANILRKHRKNIGIQFR